MPQDRFLIAPYDNNSGLQEDVRPWLLPEQAFSRLQNAYVFRSRVRKRVGSRWMGNTQLLSRLRVQIGTTDGNGDFAGTVPLIGGVPIVTPAIGQLFSVGAELFTVVSLGTPANMLISGGSTVATFNTTSGAVVINGAAATTLVYYYPSLPVMGLPTYESAATNNEMLIAFDTRFAYQYTAGFERISDETTANAARWTGSDSQFFWTCTWGGANIADKVFFVTNFNPNEPNFMRILVPFPVAPLLRWDNFRPQVSVAAAPLIDVFLNSARIIVPFKNRLLALNTWELEDDGVNPPTLINYSMRVRYCQIGSPLEADAWDQNIGGKGGFADAATSEAIRTVEFIKDRLIVYFERSTWELVYSGNEVKPFSWQQINTELGAESTFSIVPFDKVAIGVGNVGIHACNGINVERIDEKIPDLVFNIHNSNAGVERVYGIRDYFVEAVYWAYPNTARDSTFYFPDKILLYNYRNTTWAVFDDSVTAFGYFQPQTGITWDSTTVTWNDDVSWDSGALQAQFRQVIAGNQEGYVFIFDSLVPVNASVIQITQIAVVANIVTITAINHNFRDAEYVYISGVVDTTGNLSLLNDKIFHISLINPLTANTFSFIYSDEFGNILAGIYAGGGVISRVSNITITTKQYNFYTQQGRNAAISKVDCLVTTTPHGQIDVNYSISSSSNNLLSDSNAAGTNSLLGTGALDTFPYPRVEPPLPPPTPLPYEWTSSRVWHPVYIQADGEVIQLQFQMNNLQMRNTRIRDCDLEIHALCIYAQPSSSRFQ